MLRKAVSISISEAMMVILLPVFSSLFSDQIPLTFVVLLYVFILGVLSFYSIERSDKKVYGDKVYERSHYGHTSQLGFYKFIGLQLVIVMVMATLEKFSIRLEHGMLVYILTNTVILMYLYQSKMKVKLYTNGILYKRNFYDFRVISEAMLVKNYDEEYEYHIKWFRPRIILTSQEVKLVKSLHK